MSTTCSSHLQDPSLAPGGPQEVKHLYVQVENTLAVQILQPLHQLLDVHLDLQPRPGLRGQPSPTSRSVPPRSELGMVPGAGYVQSLPDPQGQGIPPAWKWMGLQSRKHLLSQELVRDGPTGQVVSGRGKQRPPRRGVHGRASRALLRSCDTL